MGGVAPAERRVVRAVLAVYPAAALGTVADLAAAAHTSSATVVRLVQKLGYEGFPDFQAALRGELATRRTGPMERLGGATQAGEDDGDDLAGGMAKALAEVVASTATSVPPAELEAAVGLVADPTRRLFLAGGRVSHSLAEYLATHLVRLRPGVQLLERDPMRRRSSLLDLTRRDVLVAFDFRRYEAETVELTRLARARGARVVAVTDLLLSPIAVDATVVLPVEVDSPSPFDTAVGAMALIEVLMAATLRRLGRPAIERMTAWEHLAGGDVLAE